MRGGGGGGGWEGKGGDCRRQSLYGSRKGEGKGEKSEKKSRRPAASTKKRQTGKIVKQPFPPTRRDEKGGKARTVE